MKKYDPYRDHKQYHMAAKFRKDGIEVSALCFKKPRAINLARELWTITPGAVTCRKCLALMPAVPAPDPEARRDA